MKKLIAVALLVAVAVPALADITPKFAPSERPVYVIVASDTTSKYITSAVPEATVNSSTGFLGAAVAETVSLWCAGSGALSVKQIRAWAQGSSTDYIDFTLSATGGTGAKMVLGQKYRVYTNGNGGHLQNLNFAIPVGNAGTMIYGAVSSPNMAGGFSILY